MKTFITQPTYLPWIGIFKAIDYCDNFIFHDDVQFEKQSWQQRNRILNINKEYKPFVYLSVAVEKHPVATLIKDIKIKDRKFYSQHLNLININYHNCSYLNDVLGMLNEVYCHDYEFLADLDINLITKISNYIGIKTNFYRSRDLNVSGDRNQKLVNLCKIFKTDMYLSAVGSRDYLNNNLFSSQDIKINFLSFEHPVYSQSKPDFFSHLSIIDVLINIGPKETKRLIRNIKI